MPLVGFALLRIPSFRRGVLVAMLFFTTSFYLLIGILAACGIDGPPLSTAVFLAELGQGVAFPPLFATVRGNVPMAQTAVAPGIANFAL